MRVMAPATLEIPIGPLQDSKTSRGLIPWLDEILRGAYPGQQPPYISGWQLGRTLLGLFFFVEHHMVVVGERLDGL